MSLISHVAELPFHDQGETELSKNEVTAMFCSVSSMLTISNVTAAHHATHIGPEQ